MSVMYVFKTPSAIAEIPTSRGLGHLLHDLRGEVLQRAARLVALVLAEHLAVAKLWTEDLNMSI